MNHFAISKVSLIDRLLTFFCWFRSLVVELEQKRKGEKREHVVGATVQLGMNGQTLAGGWGRGHVCVV